MPSPPGSSRSSCCAGPAGSTRASGAAGGSGRPARSRWRCSPGYPLTHWQEAARIGGAIRPWYVVLTVPRPVLHQRIARRAEEMVRRGLIEEVAAVLAEGPPAGCAGTRRHRHSRGGRVPSRPARQRDTVAEAIATSTRQYAKRQETWFRHQLAGEVLTLDATTAAGEGGGGDRRAERIAIAEAGDWR